MTTCLKDIAPSSPAAIGAPIRTRLYEGRTALTRLAPSWDDLFTRASFASPHVSRPWTEAWIDRSPDADRPLAVTAWQGDRMVGLLLLAVRRHFTARVARTYGAARPGYHGVLIDIDCPQAAGALAHACALHRPFDCIVLDNHSTLDRGTRSFFDQLRHDGWRSASTRRTICHRVDLESSFASYLGHRHSSKVRYNLSRLERLARREHDLQIQRFDGGDIDDAVLDRIAHIQYHSWMRRRGAAVFLHDRWRSLVLRVARSGLVRVWILRIDAQDAAFIIATISGDNLYYEWTAFNLAFRELSAGRLLTKHVIEEAGRDGFRSLDFGQGDATYKRFWATDHHFVHRIAAASGPSGCSALLLYRALWSLPPTGRVLRSYRALRRLGRRMAQERISTTSTRHRIGRTDTRPLAPPCDTSTAPTPTTPSHAPHDR